MKLVDKHSLLSLLDARSEILDAAAIDNPFAGHAWQWHFVNQLATSESKFVIAQTNHPDVRSLMLLEYVGPGRLRGLTGYYASLYSPFCGPDPTRLETARELLRQVDDAATIDLSPMTLHDVELLEQTFAAHGWYAKRYFCFGNWYLIARGLTFPEYMRTRPSILRNTWERKRKRFKGEARIELITGGEIETRIEAFRSVYARSWKRPEPYPNFVPEWARICHAKGWLRMGIAWVNDIPIAAQFWFVTGGRAYIYKLAYDEAYASWSAGTVLTAALMEHVLDVDRVDEVDYLTGDDAYKQTWMHQRRERMGVIGCNPRTLGGLARAVYERAGSLRQRVRSSVGHRLAS